MDKSLICKSCQNPISETYYFCPYCGRKLRAPPPSTSIGKQIGIYFTAIFFSLFAIAPAISYLNQKDDRSRAIGTISLLIAGISFMVSLYLTVLFFRQFGSVLINPLGHDTILNSMLK